MNNNKNSKELGSVDFNHLWVTLEQETFVAIRKSNLVGRFFSIGDPPEGKNQPIKSAAFLLGKRAYIEFLAPDGTKANKEGFSGIAFNVRRLGEIDEYENQLRRIAQNRVRRDLRVRNTEKGDVPWFHFIHLENTDSPAFFAGVIDVHEDYFPWRGIEFPDDGQYSRSDYLKASGVPATTLVDDVEEIELRLTKREAADLKLFLTTLGLNPVQDDQKTYFQAGDFRLVSAEEHSPGYRIRRIVCTMPKAQDITAQEQFGPDAFLKVSAGKLVWEFGS